MTGPEYARSGAATHGPSARAPLGAARAAAPPRDRLHAGQLRAVLGLTLAEMLRPGRDRMSGAQVRPLRQIAIAMAIMGATFSANLWRLPIETYVVMLFAVAFGFVLLSVQPDTEQVRQVHVDVLQSRPVSPRTLVAAMAVRLLLVAALIAGGFGAITLVAAWLYGALPGVSALSAWVALVAGAFSALLLWLVAMLRLLRVVSVERMRATSQLLMILLILAVAASSVGMLPASASGLPPGVGAALAAGVDALPSTWFARLALHGVAPVQGRPLGAAALAMVLLAAGLTWRGGYEEGQLELVEAAQRRGRRSASPSLASRATAAWGRAPLLGRWVTPTGAAVAGLALAVTEREEVSRVKLLAPRLIALLAVGAGLALEDRRLPLAMLGYLGFAAVFEGLDVTRQSADATASWVLWKAPVPPVALLRGQWLALLVRFLPVPALGIALLLALERSPGAAAAMAVGYLAALRLAFAAAVWLSPAVPLSGEQRTAQSLLGFALAIVLSTGWLAAAALLSMVDERAPLVAAVSAGLAAASAVVGRWSLEQLALRRLAALEYPH